MNAAAKSLQDAVNAASKGNLDETETICRELLKQSPEDADVLQILALALKTKGDLDAAEPFFKRSLEINPAQPFVQTNYGNLLVAQKKHDAAVAAYQKALANKPDFDDALAGLANAYIGQLDGPNAFRTAQSLLERNNQSALGFCLAGRALHLMHEFPTAIASLKRALELDPKYFDAAFHLGAAYLWDGKTKEAIDSFINAADLNPKSAAALCQLGHAYNNLGDVETAINAYKHAIELEPELSEAHDMLNKLCFELRKTDDYLTSYPAALARAPKALPLYLQYAKYLSLTVSVDEALNVLSDAKKNCGDQPEIARGIARIHAQKGEWVAAIEQFEQAIGGAPDDVASLEGLARVQIITGDYDSAATHVAKVSTLEPFEQQNIAYDWLCRRLSGDESASTLYDFDRFVRSFDSTPPAEAGGTAEFNEALADYLHTLHKTQTHPIDQTLRAGTQTHGLLFDSNAPLIEAVKASISEAVEQYVNELPDDPNHIFLSRKTNGFRYSGSWSVRLGEGGHHVNHVHSAGWISSAYYVELPDDLDPSRNEGWIKFGETDLQLGDREIIGKMLQPAVGKLVLFPSYMYHGTFPIASKKPRMTIAFDVVPN